MRTHHIKSKIIMSFVLVILIFVLTSSAVIYFYINNILTERIIKDNTIIVSNLGQKLSYDISEIVKYSLDIAMNDEVQQYLLDNSQQYDFDYYLNANKLINELNEYVLMRDSLIDSIFIVDKNESVISVSGKNAESVNSDWYKNTLKANTNSGFSKPHNDPNDASFQNDSMAIVSYIQKIYYKGLPGKYLGKIVVNIKYNTITSAFNNTNGSLEGFIITDENKTPIYISEFYEYEDLQLGTILKTKNREDVLEFDNKYYISKEIPENSWILVGILPAINISSNLKYMNLFLAAIIILCLVVMMIIIIPLVDNITKPLVNLVSGMKEISEGKLNTEIQVKGNDEIKELAIVFNKMVKDIKVHIDEIVAQEKVERDIKLRLFMSQINPHFIYNTLNTIIYIARKKGDEEIISVTKSFINILQNTIQAQPDEMTTVESEMKFINSYIDILRYRYNNIVAIKWELDSLVRENEIPRMMLYPLIENSVFHGIFPKNKRGKIIVKIMVENDFIMISISDNGIGISEKDLIDLKERLDKTDDLEYLEHIGLFNANYRLKLLYGESYKLNIKSIFGKGTTISFDIPISNDS